MCCRYLFAKNKSEYVQRLVPRKKIEMKTGEIGPGNAGTVVFGQNGHLEAANMIWGFPAFGSKQLLINARSETIFEKKSFADSARHRRAVVPAERFFEWDYQKEKVAFDIPDCEVMYLAGIFDVFGTEERFTVLTTAANASVMRFHDRMPLILSEDQVHSWIFDDKCAQELLKVEPERLPKLHYYKEYEQMSLF